MRLNRKNKKRLLKKVEKKKLKQQQKIKKEEEAELKNEQELNKKTAAANRIENKAKISLNLLDEVPKVTPEDLKKRGADAACNAVRQEIIANHLNKQYHFSPTHEKLRTFVGQKKWIGWMGIVSDVVEPKKGSNGQGRILLDKISQIDDRQQLHFLDFHIWLNVDEIRVAPKSLYISIGDLLFGFSKVISYLDPSNQVEKFGLGPTVLVDSGIILAAKANKKKDLAAITTIIDNYDRKDDWIIHLNGEEPNREIAENVNHNLATHDFTALKDWKGHVRIKFKPNVHESYVERLSKQKRHIEPKATPIALSATVVKLYHRQKFCIELRDICLLNAKKKLADRVLTEYTRSFWKLGSLHYSDKIQFKGILHWDNPIGKSRKLEIYDITEPKLLLASGITNELPNRRELLAGYLDEINGKAKTDEALKFNKWRTKNNLPFAEIAWKPTNEVTAKMIAKDFDVSKRKIDLILKYKNIVSTKVENGEPIYNRDEVKQKLGFLSGNIQNNMSNKLSIEEIKNLLHTDEDIVEKAFSRISNNMPYYVAVKEGLDLGQVDDLKAEIQQMPSILNLTSKKKLERDWPDFTDSLLDDAKISGEDESFIFGQLYFDQDAVQKLKLQLDRKKKSLSTITGAEEKKSDNKGWLDLKQIAQRANAELKTTKKITPSEVRTTIENLSVSSTQMVRKTQTIGNMLVNRYYYDPVVTRDVIDFLRGKIAGITDVQQPTSKVLLQIHKANGNAQRVYTSYEAYGIICHRFENIPKLEKRKISAVFYSWIHHLVRVDQHYTLRNGKRCYKLQQIVGIGAYACMTRVYFTTVTLKEFCSLLVYALDLKDGHEPKVFKSLINSTQDQLDKLEAQNGFKKRYSLDNKRIIPRYLYSKLVDIFVNSLWPTAGEWSENNNPFPDLKHIFFKLPPETKSFDEWVKGIIKKLHLSIKRNSVTRYVKNHPKLFEQHIYYTYNGSFLDSRARKLLLQDLTNRAKRQGEINLFNEGSLSKEAVPMENKRKISPTKQNSLASQSSLNFTVNQVSELIGQSKDKIAEYLGSCIVQQLPILKHVHIYSDGNFKMDLKAVELLKHHFGNSDKSVILNHDKDLKGVDNKRSETEDLPQKEDSSFLLLETNDGHEFLTNKFSSVAAAKKFLNENNGNYLGKVIPVFEIKKTKINSLIIKDVKERKDIEIG